MIKLQSVYHRKKHPLEGVLKKGALFPTQYCHVHRFSCLGSLEEHQNTRLLIFSNRSIIIFKDQFSAQHICKFSIKMNLPVVKKGTGN